MPLIQPPDAPTFATTTNYPAGAEPWAGLARRLAPTSPEAAAGLTPGQQFPAEWYNYHVGAALDSLLGLSDVFALNWPGFGTTETDVPAGGFDPSSPAFSTSDFSPLIVSARHLSTFEPYLVAYGCGSNLAYRSRDGHRWEAGTSGAVPALALVSDGFSVILLDQPNSRTYASADLGRTWPTSRNLTFGSHGGADTQYHGLGYSPQFGKLYVFGPNVVDHALAPYTFFTGAVLPTLPGGESTGGNNFAAPREYETGAGVVIYSGVVINGNYPGSTAYAYSLDGVSFAAKQITSAFGAGSLVQIVWSESWRAWFALFDSGDVYRAATLASTWVRVASLGDAGRYRGMTTLGRNFVIFGAGPRQSDAFGFRGGDVLVTADFSRVSVLNPHAGQYANVGSGTTANDPYPARAVDHDGQIVLARTRRTGTSAYQLECVLGMRSPYLR